MGAAAKPVFSVAEAMREGVCIYSLDGLGVSFLFRGPSPITGGNPATAPSLEKSPACRSSELNMLPLLLLLSLPVSVVLASKPTSPSVGGSVVAVPVAAALRGEAARLLLP